MLNNWLPPLHEPRPQLQHQESHSRTSLEGFEQISTRTHYSSNCHQESVSEKLFKGDNFLHWAICIKYEISLVILRCFIFSLHMVYSYKGEQLQVVWSTLCSVYFNCKVLTSFVNLEPHLYIINLSISIRYSRNFIGHTDAHIQPNHLPLPLRGQFVLNTW